MHDTAARGARGLLKNVHGIGHAVVVAVEAKVELREVQRVEDELTLREVSRFNRRKPVHNAEFYREEPLKGVPKTDPNLLACGEDGCCHDASEALRYP
jgi:hypothetical protein